MNIITNSLKYIGIGCASYFILQKGYFWFKKNEVDVLYKVLHWACFLQIKATQIHEMLIKVPLLRDINTYFGGITKTTLEFVKGGEVVYTCTMEKLEVITADEVASLELITMMVTDIVSKDEIDFIKIFQPLSNVNYVRILPTEPPEELKPEASNAKFILLEVVFNQDDKFKIDLETEKENYYLVNNVIDKKLLRYLLNCQHKKNILEMECDETKIRIDILDNNVTSHSIDFNKSIVILKDGYEII